MPGRPHASGTYRLFLPLVAGRTLTADLICRQETRGRRDDRVLPCVPDVPDSTQPPETHRRARIRRGPRRGGGAVGRPAAHADVVDVDHQCKTPIGDKSAVSPIDIEGERSGSGYKITMSWQKGVSSSPVELGKGAMNPSATIRLGGADSGTMTVTGPANQEAIPADTPIKIST